eukprot:CCRYP_015614-RA/>CCRYP_015614-RA protein AED:0.58 eAED:0.70 QI:34/0/0/0.66/0/0/3/0/128
MYTKNACSCSNSVASNTKDDSTSLAASLGLTHFNTQQKADLLSVLMENSKMFDGTLGVYPHKKGHLELDPKPVPCIHLSTFNKKLDHLVALGMLIPQKEIWMSLLDQQPSSTEQVDQVQAISLAIYNR